jgi:RND family efflux transporter MFP subunit
VPVRVTVTSVQRETAHLPVEVPGIVHPTERALIAARISGHIEMMAVALGQKVQRGDLLVRLAVPELTARVSEARAQLDQAVREEKRNRDLAASGADSADAAHAAVERLAAARAAVAEAEAMLAYAEIRAPFDGRIAQKLAYTGDLATPDRTLLVLERSGGLQIEAAVPASLTAGLAVGDAVEATVAETEAPLRATIMEIAGAADPGTHTVLVKLAAPGLDAALSGRAARVLFAGPPTDSLLVPANVVSRFGQMERVFVTLGDRVQLRLVKTGARRGDRLEILAGLTAGENVVLAPPAALHEGDRITATP